MSEIEEYDQMWRFKGIAFSKNIYPTKEDVLAFAKAKGWITDEPTITTGTTCDYTVSEHKSNERIEVDEKPKKKRWSGLRKKSSKKRKKKDE